MHRNRLVVSMQVSPLRKFNERDEESFIWKTVCIVLKRENFYNFIVLYVVKYIYINKMTTLAISSKCTLSRNYKTEKRKEKKTMQSERAHWRRHEQKMLHITRAHGFLCRKYIEMLTEMEREKKTQRLSPWIFAIFNKFPK